MTHLLEPTIRRLIVLGVLAGGAGCVAIPAPADEGGSTGGVDETDAGGDGPAVDAAAPPEESELVCDGSSAETFESSYVVGRQSGDFAAISDSTHDGLDLTGSFTIEAWLIIDSELDSANTYAIVTKDDFGTGSRGYTWYIDKPASGVIMNARVAQGDNSRGSEMDWPLSPELLGSWHHYALRFNTLGSTVENSLQLFVDGVLVSGLRAFDEVDQNDVHDSTADFVVGAWPISGVAGQHFVGAIDELRVWDRSLSEDDILEGMDGVLLGDELGLVGYWRFDGSLEDSSTKGNHLVATSPDYCSGPF